jgi:hypothetical protein
MIPIKNDTNKNTKIMAMNFGPQHPAAHGALRFCYQCIKWFFSINYKDIGTIYIVLLGFITVGLFLVASTEGLSSLMVEPSEVEQQEQILPAANLLVNILIYLLTGGSIEPCSAEDKLNITFLFFIALFFRIFSGQ